jgi:Flp pilus assembly protein TadG
MPRVGKHRNRKAAALVEMAVVFPVLLMLILGMVEVGRLGMVSQLVTTAAREGCRVAVLNGKTQANVEARIEELLESAGIDDHSVTYSPSTWSSVKASDTNNFIAVTVTVDYDDVTWLPMPWFLNDAQVVGSATLSSERQ